MDILRGWTASLVEEVDAGAHAASRCHVNRVHSYLRITESHPCAYLPSAPPRSPWHRSSVSLRVLLVVQHISEVEAQRTTAAYTMVRHERGVRTLSAVDVYDRRTLTRTRWRIAAYYHVAHRHLQPSTHAQHAEIG